MKDHILQINNDVFADFTFLGVIGQVRQNNY